MLRHSFSVVLVFFSIGFTSILYAQETTNMSNEPCGSAGDLKGSNLIINCFISEKGNEWTPQEKQATLNKEREGVAWLQRQAGKWGVPVPDFKEYNLGVENDITVAKIERAHEPSTAHLKIRWVNYALNAAGYSDVTKLYATLKEQYKTDNMVVFVFANKTGRSYAQPLNNGIDKLYPELHLEGAVIYKNYYDIDHDLYPGTIMHEMLHLYGAWDMYHDENTSIEVQNIIHGVFKHSIMLDDHVDNLNYLSIDQMTAWRIGWIKSYLPCYEVFRNTNDPKMYWEKLPGVKMN
jgi:hypothetical protein